MTIVETRKYEMLVRVRDFGRAHGDWLPGSAAGREAFAAVDAAVAKLNEHTANQYSSRRAARPGPSTDTTAYRTLVEMLDAISRTARAVALDTPGADSRFSLPSGKGKLAMVNAARAFARDAAPYAQQFVAHGMPEDFIARLEAKIEGFEQALLEREAARRLSASARASITQTLDEGFVAVQRLDAIVGNVLGEDNAAMAEWQVARRIERRGVTKGGGSASQEADANRSGPSPVEEAPQTA